jgi:hypothetical protein
MKRFFYSHPLMTQVLLVVFLLLPSTGLVAPLFLEIFGIQLTNLLLLLCMLGGPILSLLLALPFLCIPTLKCLDETLDELYRLKQGRKAFHAPQAFSSIKQAKTFICKRLSSQQMKRHSYLPPETPLISCVGVWVKNVYLSMGNSRRMGAHVSYTVPTYYLLYTADKLNACDWENVCQRIQKHLFHLEKESRSCDRFYSAYAVCVLCNGVDATVAEQVQTIQDFGEVKAHICIGVVPENNWYLPAYRNSKSKISGLARNLLKTATFGLEFPYKGNREYTDAFLNRVDELCNSRLKDHVTQRQVEAAKNGLRNLFSGSSTALEEDEPF